MFESEIRGVFYPRILLSNLLILTGIKWIKTSERDILKIVRLGQKGYLDIIESGVSNGDCVLIESIGESLDPVLDPLLGRNTIKKGR